MTPLVAFTWPETAISIGVVLLVSIVLRIVLRRAIRLSVSASIAAADRHRASTSPADKFLGRITGTADERHQARVKTLGSVLTNAVDIVLVIVVVLTILRVLAIPLEPVLAASGIGGIALAFGAQSLVKDYISGMLMIFEDQFGVGDLINTGEVTGTVEEVGLRVTRLRDATGQVWYVRNGEIVRIGNQSQGWSTGTADVPIASTEDPARAIEVLRGMVAEMYADEAWSGVLLEEPSVAGVNEVRAGVTTIRIFAKTAPNQHWGVQRALLERGVTALHAAGIKGATVIPFAPPQA
ncbi:MAG TPA: mechanosensitive ion channel [Propionibacterium sp.]|nr:mechanosensitive ion channel [Propionibacterium sp.]